MSNRGKSQGVTKIPFIVYVDLAHLHFDEFYRTHSDFFLHRIQKKKKKKRRRRKKQAKYQLQQWPDHRQFSDSDILCAHNYSDFLLYMVNHIQRPCWSLIWLILRYSQSQQEKHIIGSGIGKILMIHCVYEKKEIMTKILWVRWL